MANTHADTEHLTIQNDSVPPRIHPSDHKNTFSRAHVLSFIRVMRVVLKGNSIEAYTIGGET